MKNYVLSLISLLVLNSCSVFQKNANIEPKWINEPYRNQLFSSEDFYMYFEEKSIKDFSSNKEKEFKNEFSRDIKNQLVKQIVEKISFSTTSSELQTENNKIDYISSVLRESSQKATATLIGAKEEFYVNKKKNTISAIIYVKKVNLVNGYKSILNSKIEMLHAKIDQDVKDELKEISPLNLINSELLTIQNEMEIYAVLSPTRDNLLIEKYNKMYESYRILNSKYGNDSNKIEILINEADRLYLDQASFEIIISKLDEALLYDATNVKVIGKKNEYKNKWVIKLTAELNSKTSNKEYQAAINILDKLIVIDQNNDLVYSEKKKNIIADYFKSTLSNIKNLIRNGSLYEGIKQLNEISKYSYVDVNEFEKIKTELEEISIENAISTAQNYIFEKKYEVALSHCKQNLILYPSNKQLKRILDEILDLIGEKKKIELLQSRPNRYVFEINYSLSHLPELIKDNNSSINNNFNATNVDFGNKIGNYQFGLYRKININLKQSEIGKNSKFSYSQIGIRAGYLDLSNNVFKTDSGVSYLYKQSKITQLEASFIWRRFFMFNVGYLTETLPKIDVNSVVSGVEQSYVCSTVGIRIPFDFIHLTADVTGYSDFGNLIKAYAKVGVSINLSFSKKYNSDDKKYIENEIIKLRNN